MRVLLLNPPFKNFFSRQSRSPGVAFGGTLYYPYYLAYTTGVLEKEGFDEYLIDAVANKWSHDRTIEEIKKINPELIVMDTSTPSIVNDLEFSKIVKSNFSNVHINMVGTHPTAEPKWILNYNESVDSVSIGEYDYTVRDLAFLIKEGKENFDCIKGLAYKKNRKVIINRKRNLIENLNELPFVSKVYNKHLNIKNYFYASLESPQITILTARGCKYGCSFCNTPFKHSYRTRSPDNVIAEFEYIQNELSKVKEIMIEDDTFGLDKEFTIKFCKKKIEKNIKIPWSCNLRVNTGVDLLKLMKEAGCRLACVGFETPSKKSLKDIQKGITVDMSKEFMKNARDIGILINGCFIVGLLSDTKENITRTIDYAIELFPDTAQFYPLMVYPGTEDYKRAEEMNLLRTKDYTKWLTSEGHYITTIKQENLDAEKIRKLQIMAYKRYHMNPKYIFYKLLQSLKDKNESARNIKGFISFVEQVLMKGNS